MRHLLRTRGAVSRSFISLETAVTMFTSKTKMASGWRTPWKLSSPLDKQQPVSRATVLDTRLPEGEQVRPAGWRPSQDGLGLEVGGRALRPSLAGICFRHTNYKKIVPKRISLNLWKKKKKRRVCAQAIEPRTRAQQGRKPAFPTSWEHPGRGVRSKGDLAGPPLSAWWLAEQRGHATHGLVQPSVPTSVLWECPPHSILWKRFSRSGL